MPQYVPFNRPESKFEINHRLRKASAWFSGMEMKRLISQTNPVSPPRGKSAPPSEDRTISRMHLSRCGPGRTFPPVILPGSSLRLRGLKTGGKHDEAATAVPRDQSAG